MKRKWFAGGVGIMFMLCFFTGSFAAAFWLTAFFYQKIGLSPPDLLVQIINSLLGLSFILLIMTLIRFKHEVKHFELFKAMIDAMEQIAKGNFDIQLDNYNDNGHFDELAQSINKMAMGLNQLERMREEFISNVSHEIQSPLTSIRGFAQALRNEKLSHEERMHYLSIIETESRRLSKLSDNMLRLVSLEAENVGLELKSYRLDKQVRSIILACEPQWRDKQIDLDISLEEITVAADENRLSQVWLNLLHNSIKFTPEGGSIRIELYRRRDGQIEFKIADTGIGIAADDLAHIFERFYKADKSRERSNKGSGLGLSIVRKIVDLHHGTIDVQSAVGEGTTFTVSLRNLN
jgi:two-component system phosphate regulon sensor histidine kinase PhoR